MPENTLSLYELALMLEACIEDVFGEQFYWVTAEIASINVRRGHCYLNLIEKDPGSTFPKAEMKAIIWQNNYTRVNEKFASVTGFPLKQDISILFLASLNFNPRYGFSLNIIDIKGEFTLGGMMLERQKTIELLKEKGIYGLNKTLQFPEVPQRIAALSATDSKGFEDFLNVLGNNPYGFKFYVKLFPVMLQGNRAAESIALQLKALEQQKDKFDLVILVRGGGGNVDLHCFNSYTLAEAIALSPLPVVTGIGHTTDYTVADEVAAISKETPTAVANFIIATTLAFEDSIQQRSETLKMLTLQLLDYENMHIEALSEKLKLSPTRLLDIETIHIQTAAEKLKLLPLRLFSSEQIYLNRMVGLLSTKTLVVVNIAGEYIRRACADIRTSYGRLIEQQKLYLNNTEQLVAAHDPLRLLEKGYSLTRKNGKTITNLQHLKPGDAIETLTAGGTIQSTVTQTFPKPNNNQQT